MIPCAPPNTDVKKKGGGGGTIKVSKSDLPKLGIVTVKAVTLTQPSWVYTL